MLLLMRPVVGGSPIFLYSGEEKFGLNVPVELKRSSAEFDLWFIHTSVRVE